MTDRWYEERNEALAEVKRLKAQLAECRECVRVERQGYNLATEAAAENASRFTECRKELVECQARWRLAQRLDLAARSSDLGRLLEERWPTPALDAALEDAQVEMLDMIAQHRFEEVTGSQKLRAAVEAVSIEWSTALEQARAEERAAEVNGKKGGNDDGKLAHAG